MTSRAGHIERGGATFIRRGSPEMMTAMAITLGAHAPVTYARFDITQHAIQLQLARLLLRKLVGHVAQFDDHNTGGRITQCGKGIVALSVAFSRLPHRGM